MDLLLVKQTVSEGVLAGGAGGFRLFKQVFAADDAVLVITQQRLDGLGLLGNLVLPGGGRDIAQALGALADQVQRLVRIVLGLGESSKESRSSWSACPAAAFAAFPTFL